MSKENGGNDHEDRENCPDDDQEADWVEKHLMKIIVLVGVLCVLGLVGRALTG